MVIFRVVGPAFGLECREELALFERMKLTFLICIEGDRLKKVLCTMQVLPCRRISIPIIQAACSAIAGKGQDVFVPLGDLHDGVAVRGFNEEKPAGPIGFKVQLDDEGIVGIHVARCEKAFFPNGIARHCVVVHCE